LFTIHSVDSEKELVFSLYQGEQFQVDLKGYEVSAMVNVWNGGKCYSSSLPHFFKNLAFHKKPWSGSKEWGSLDGELKISATCTTLGQVAFAVELRQAVSGPEEWLVKASIVTELGQLDKIAKDARAFF
jgi:hypothetical protein